MLSIRARNALCNHFDVPQLLPQQVASLSRDDVLRINHLGPKSLPVIEAWLAEHSCELKHSSPAPVVRNGKLEQQYARYLASRGWVITPPTDGGL